ncbi:MAG TPA: hypothetical protein VI454_10540 [Verrucomicrobiae bacterium]|jgi:hypothetical protein
MAYHLTEIFSDPNQAEARVRFWRNFPKKQVRLIVVDNFGADDMRTNPPTPCGAAAGAPLYLVQHEDVSAPAQPAPIPVVTIPEP